MKNGICPKCNSEEVYWDESRLHGIRLYPKALTIHPTLLYVCADCGFLEFYAQTGFDFSKVKEKFQKVKN